MFVERLNLSSSGAGISAETIGEIEEAVGESTGGAQQGIAGKSPSRIAMERLLRDKTFMVCSAIFLIMVLAALFAPLICKAMGIYYDSSQPGAPTPSDMLDVFGDQMPIVGPPDHGFTIHHPLGLAPRNGLDNFAILLYGMRASLTVAVSATVLSTIIGVVLGLLAGFSRGWLDRIITFVIDLFLSFPLILMGIALSPLLMSHFRTNQAQLPLAQKISLIAILTIFGWMGLARLVRGQVLSLREREFIQAAQVIGVPTRRVLFRELLPNLVAPIVVATSMALPAYVATEAGFSYLGIGLNLSLGNTVNLALQYWQQYPLYLWTPVAAITILVLTLNLIGDGIRDAFDPKTRR
jgi:ABC-type dipeptide/oligopeptide/nickel transport system permease subunit